MAGWLAGCSIALYACLNGLLHLTGYIEKKGLNGTYSILLYNDCNLIDGKICMVNK
jgi:hypothetical protein